MKRYYYDFIVAPAMSAMMLAYGGINSVTAPLLFAGIFLWTFIEYAVHRWPLHNTETGKRIHDPHHADPFSTDDEAFVARIAAAVLVSAMVVVFMPTYGPALLAGLLLGYFAFVALHHGTHHWRMSRHNIFYRCKLRHVAHHKFDDCNYGVTTSLWDRLFRTEHRKRVG